MISLQLIGTNIEEVGRAAADLERRIRQYEGVFDVRNSFERGLPEIKLNIKPEAEVLGLTLADLARQVRAGFYGEEVQRVALVHSERVRGVDKRYAQRVTDLERYVRRVSEMGMDEIGKPVASGKFGDESLGKGRAVGA